MDEVWTERKTNGRTLGQIVNPDVVIHIQLFQQMRVIIALYIVNIDAQ